MKITKWKLGGALLLLLGAGCFVQSIAPFYTDSAIVPMPRVTGQWLLVKELGKEMGGRPAIRPWIIRAAGADKKGGPSPAYEVTTYDPDNRESRLTAVFFSVGGETYCDVSPVQGPESNPYLDVHQCPLHTLCKVELNDNALVLRLLDKRWMLEAVNSRKEVAMTLVRRRQFGPVLSTATSVEWKFFLEKHGKTEGVFGKDTAFELKRVIDAPPGEGPRAPQK